MDIHSCHLLFDHFQFALIHGLDIPDSYAILLFTASDLASITSHIHNWVVFLLWLHPFILFGVISPLISSNILGPYWTGEFLFQYPIILPFHTVHGVLKARILKWFAIPFSSGPHSVRSLHHDCPSWVAPQAWLTFIKLDKAVVLVWLDWLVFCEYGFSVSALWCPLATPTILLGFLLPWAWGISSQLLQQSAANAPYLGQGVSPHRRPSWPSTWDSSSRHSCAHAATEWGSSSHLPPLASGLRAWGISSGPPSLTLDVG